MEFHTNKCQVLRLSNKIDHTVFFKYNIHNTILQEFDSAKYLGVTIDSHLNWKSQCNNVSKKASFMLSFLDRNCSRCPPKVKENLSNALVIPLLEYGCCVWGPYKDNQIDRLEMINKRAARFITGNYKMEHGNTDKNMKSLGWSSLSQRRSKIKLTMLFKIRTNKVHIPPEELIENSRKPLNYFIPQSSVDCHLHSYPQHYPSLELTSKLN